MVIYKLILSFVFSFCTVSGRNFGSINIDGVGTIYVVGPDWSADFVNVFENGFTLSRGGRIYFAKDPAADFNDPFMYWQTPLLGKHFSYEIGKMQSNHFKLIIKEEIHLNNHSNLHFMTFCRC